MTALNLSLLFFRVCLGLFIGTLIAGLLQEAREYVAPFVVVVTLTIILYLTKHVRFEEETEHEKPTSDQRRVTNLGVHGEPPRIRRNQTA